MASPVASQSFHQWNIMASNKLLLMHNDMNVQECDATGDAIKNESRVHEN